MALMFTAAPLLALRFGAEAIVLGAIGWVPQAVRLPICFTSGHLSEKVGRVKIVVPAACAVAVAGVGLACAGSLTQVLVYSILSVAAIGAFYPPLQAMVGDKSARGELTKNLGAFNIGWCVGGAVMAMSVRWLVNISLPLVFWLAAASAVLAGVLVFVWARQKSAESGAAVVDNTPLPQYPAYMLVVARMGNFTGFFALSVIRMLFPQLGLELGWTESDVATVAGLAVAGQGVGMLLTNTGPWWRGKLWPQFMAQGMMLLCGLIVTFISNFILIAGAVFMLGAALSIAYTAALYHGLATRKSKGKNTGFHEALIAAGSIAGCLLGGIVAQHVSLRAPYVLIAVLAVGCLMGTVVLYQRTNSKRSESC